MLALHLLVTQNNQTKGTNDLVASTSLQHALASCFILVLEPKMHSSKSQFK